MLVSLSSVYLTPIHSRSELTPSRLAQGAEVGFGAFNPDPVFRWIRPNQTPDHAERLRLYFEDRLRNVAIQQGKDHLVLAVRRSANQQTETVLGWAIWERVLGEEEKPTSDKVYGWNLGSGRSNGDISADIIQRDPDPANDECRLTTFNQAWEQADIDIARALREKASFGLHPRRKCESQNGEDSIAGFAHIKLTLIAVGPEYQRQGVGKLLVEWGSCIADKQRVPIVMGASPMGEGLYRKCGFEDLGITLRYASKEDEAEYGQLNDSILVRWPGNRG